MMKPIVLLMIALAHANPVEIKITPGDYQMSLIADRNGYNWVYQTPLLIDRWTARGPIRQLDKAIFKIHSLSKPYILAAACHPYDIDVVPKCVYRVVCHEPEPGQWRVFMVRVNISVTHSEEERLARAEQLKEVFVPESYDNLWEIEDEIGLDIAEQFGNLYYLYTGVKQAHMRECFNAVDKYPPNPALEEIKTVMGESVDFLKEQLNKPAFFKVNDPYLAFEIYSKFDAEDVPAIA